MKAILYHRYGSPDVLRFEEVDKPTPAGKEVLIKVYAASVNPYDWHFLRGTPYLLRLMAGLRKPKDSRFGVDMAGVVEALGPGVTAFKPGDEVFGSCRGAFAGYVCTAETAVVHKPANVTFAQAGSVAIAGLTALQSLRDKGHIQVGQNVLVNGAAGGVGTFAVQIARSLGADVTGVCSTRNVEMVRAIGASRVIDYTRQDFTREPERYDLVVDAVGNHSLRAIRRVLNPGGISVIAGGTAGRWMIGAFASMIAAPVLSLGSRKLVGIMARLNKEDLALLGELMKAGKVTPVIDRSYPLSETAEAIRYLEEGHARGKVVIDVAR